MKTTVVSKIELPALNPVDTQCASLGERLDLIEHVEVKLDVMLGNAAITVDRLFSMKQGDVLALETLVDEPVSVHLNSKLIARGHIIAVDDKFGVQISEIAS